MHNMLIASTFVFLGIGLVDAKSTSDNYSFMIVGGLSASTEQCLTVANGRLPIMSCWASTHEDNLTLCTCRQCRYGRGGCGFRSL